MVKVRIKAMEIKLENNTFNWQTNLLAVLDETEQTFLINNSDLQT